MTTILQAAILLVTLILLILLLIQNRKLKNQSHDQIIKLIEDYQNRGEKRILDEFSRSHANTNHLFKDLREELQHSIGKYSDSQMKILEVSKVQNTQFELIRKSVEERLLQLQKENTKKLEEMRKTVDEQLHSTLEKRLAEAFRFVSDRLEKVHQGLGDMQKLAAGVGDLKKVLSNVKTRGTLGEIQLKNQLDFLLTPQQYGENVHIREGTSNFVEFAIKLPGRMDKDKSVWLPVDSKFPLDKYESLLNEYENGDKESIAQAGKQLAQDIKGFAKDISSKYIDPPNTTDFALMYLPVEGLYAEVLRYRGLFEILQRELRVIPVGPTTLAAILNSLQMGFRTLDIEKRSSEVWELLAAVKTQFGRFGELLDKTQKKLSEASKSIETASKTTRKIEGKLNDVQELPSATAKKVLESKK